MFSFALRCAGASTKTVAACVAIVALASACDSSKPDPNASAPSLSVRIVTSLPVASGAAAPVKSTTPVEASSAAAGALGAGAYKDPKGGFAADLACQPQVTDDADHHVASCASAPYRTVRWHDEAGTSAIDPKKTFDDLRDAKQKELDQPKVVNEKDLEVGGHPARDIAIDVTKEGQPVHLLVRMLIVDRRVYEISTYDDDASERERFVSTFTLLK